MGTSKQVVKMTAKEKRELDELYVYIKKEIFHYPDSVVLPSYFIKRLKGLQHGQLIYNHQSQSKGYYDFSLILLTFKYCRFDIEKALSIKEFNNERAKFNYVMAIIESNINDVFIRLKQAEEGKKQIEEHIVKPISPSNSKYGDNYIHKTKEINPKLKDLL